MKKTLFILLAVLGTMLMTACAAEPEVVEVIKEVEVTVEVEKEVEVQATVIVEKEVEVEVEKEVEVQATVIVEKEVEVEVEVEKEVEVEVTRVVEVEAAPAVAEPRGTFRVANTVEPTNGWWKPWSSNPPAVLAHYEIPYEGLITEDAKGDIVGVLATDWSFNDDNTELTFNLREGVVFHDGTPFNAESVKSNIEFIKNENGFPPTANQLGAVEEVVVVDDYTVTFMLSRPDVALIPNLARFVGLQVSPNAYDTMETVPVGTGPYKMVPEENTPDQVWGV